MLVELDAETEQIVMANGKQYLALEAAAVHLTSTYDIYKIMWSCFNACAT